MSDRVSVNQSHLLLLQMTPAASEREHAQLKATRIELGYRVPVSAGGSLVQPQVGINRQTRTQAATHTHDTHIHPHTKV